MPLGRKILMPIESALYLCIIIFGLLSMTGVYPCWDYNQSKIVVIGGMSVFLGIFGPWLLEKILKIHLSVLVDICIAVDLFAAIVLGECCQIYRIVPGYDKILHGAGTFQFVLLGYAVFKFFLSMTNKGTHQVLLAIIFGLFFGICIECLWELYEYTFDVVSNVDMQKYRPDEFEKYIDSAGNIILSTSSGDGGVDPQLVLDYYTSKAGMQFALDDTMHDIVADSVGGLLGAIFCYLLFHFKPELQDKILYRDASQWKNGKNKENIENARPE